MQEAYRIGVALVLDSNVGAAIPAIAKEFRNLDRVIKDVQMSVNELAAGLRGLDKVGASAAASWTAAARAMRDAAAAATRASAGMAGAGAGPFGPGAGPMPSRLPALAYGAPARGLPYLPMPGGAGGAGGGGAGGWTPGAALPPPERQGRLAGPLAWSGAGGGGGGGGGGEPPPDEPFDRGQFPDLNPRGRRAPRRESGSSNFARGMELILPAAAGGYLLRDVMEPTFREGQIESGLRLMSVSPTQVKAAVAKARALTKKGAVGTTELQNLETYGALMGVVQNPTEALALLPEFAKMSTMLSGLGLDSDMTAPIKGAEFAGVLGRYDAKTGKYVVDPAALNLFIHREMAAVVATKGAVTPEMLLQFQRAGGISTATLRGSSDLFALQLAIIQSMGPARAGRGLQAFSMQFSAGKMNQADVKLLAQMGIIQHPEKVLKAGMGQYILTPGAMAPGELTELREHPGKFILDYMLPREKAYLAKHYGKAYTQASPAVQLQMEAAETQQITSRIPGGVYAVETVRNQALIERDRAAYERALKTHPYETMLATNPEVQVRALTAAWQSFEIALGTAAEGPAIKALNLLTVGLNDLTAWATAHPDGAKVALEGLAAGIGLLGTAAAIALTRGVAGQFGALAGGLGLLEGPLAIVAGPAGILALAYGLDRLAKATTSFPHWLIDMVAGAGAGAAIAGWPGAVVGAGAAAAMDLVGVGQPLTFTSGPLAIRPAPHPTVMPPTSSNGHSVVHVAGGHVSIDNPGDMKHGVVSGIMHDANNPNTGPTGGDVRDDPWGAAFQGGLIPP